METKRSRSNKDLNLINTHYFNKLEEVLKPKSTKG